MKKKQYSNHFYLHVSASFFLLPLFFISLAYAKITVIDLIFRVDSVCQRYEKYDVQKQRELNAYGDGVFSRLFAAVELETHAALQIRAAAVAMNAEVRRKKARLMDEVPKLCKLALKKVKGVPKEELEVGDDLVLALQERIKAIPDRSTSGAKQSGGWASSASSNNIKFDLSDGNFESEYFQHSEESSQFRNEYDMRKMKRACEFLYHFYAMEISLDIISEGLDVLKNLAHDMNEMSVEELNSQVPLIDEIDSKIKNTNVRLKKTLYEVRFRPKLPHQCRFSLYNSWNRFLLVQYMKLSWIKSLLFKWLNYGIALSCEVLGDLLVVSALSSSASPGAEMGWKAVANYNHLGVQIRGTSRVEMIQQTSLPSPEESECKEEFEETGQ
ncbi:Syntaxin-71, partial [Cucurbita argyrosperma subsp. argyrosperma]